MSFLSSMLPTIIGAGVGAATGNPYLGAAAAGAFGYSKHGSLGEGLMAGLAGYGGAGLAQGITPEMLATKGGETAANTTTQATQQLAEQEAAHQAALNRAQTDFLSQPLSNDPTKYNFANIDRTNAVVGYDKAADAYMNTPNAVTEANLARANSSLPAGSGGMSTTPTPSISDLLAKNATFGNVSMAAGPILADAIAPKPIGMASVEGDTDMGPRYRFETGVANPFPEANTTGAEKNYYPNQKYTQLSEADAKALYGFADGGGVQFPYGESVMRMARGGLSDLGGYSDGGRLLRGPGDGVSDSIPAVIGRKQPARLADGEFVVPARIVSELGNGSTEAGARQLYKMMDRVQKSRSKTTGKGKIAKNTNAARYLPA